MKEKKKKVSEIITNIIFIAFCIILIPILVTNLVLIIKGAINKEELPSVFGISPLAVETDSMYPVFSGGDLILIHKCPADEMSVGDIISYYEPTVTDRSVIVTHRIVEIQQNDDGTRSFVTKGDANNANDAQAISEDYAIGKQVATVPNLGRFIMFLSTTKGMLLCVVLPICLLFGFDYIRRLFEKSNQKNKADISG